MEPSTLEPPARLLGIDYGEARIGLAVSDDLGFLAPPLETIHCKQTHPLERIAAIIKERQIAKIIIGLPLRLDSTEGPAAEKVRAFAQRLKSALPPLPMEFVDETYSTMDAQSRLHEAGRNTKQSKAIIDQAAAVVILQGYLDR